ncbi:hypothetical protein V3481_007122 [Fusarium oxysporum f. sp. vasinfectum]
MCCGLYDAGMFTKMEMHVLGTLDWTIGPTTVEFSQLMVAEAAYLCEIALYHRDFVSTKPSVMAKPINKHTTNIFKAPQKGHSAMEFDGYSTPPITSDSNSLMSNHNMAKESYGLPPQRWVTSIPPNHAAVCGPSQYVGCSNQHGMNQYALHDYWIDDSTLNVYPCTPPWLLRSFTNSCRTQSIARADL